MSEGLKQIVIKPYEETTKEDYKAFNNECKKRGLNPILEYVKFKKEQCNIK